MIAWVGSYTRAGGEGIYRLRLDPTSGALLVDGVAARATDPSFLALDPAGERLYAVGETSEGTVSAFAVEPGGGSLSLLGRQPSGGDAPCHLSLDRAGRAVLVANYGSGTAAVLPLRPDGSLEPPAAVARHAGSGPHPERQDAPHAHCALPSPDGDLAYVVDLGIDRVAAYRLGPGGRALEPEPAAGATLPPGSGPRHLIFHPDGRRAFLVCELSSQLVALELDPGTGALRATRTLSTLPDGFAGDNTAAALHLSPDGRRLYASNRGHDSIAVFDVEGDDVATLQHHPAGVRGPRDFRLDPTGCWMVVAGEGSGRLVTLAVSGDDGTLADTGHAAEVPSPVCVTFAGA